MLSFLEYPQFIAYTTTVLFLNILPGMNVMFICAQSIQGGKRYGVCGALGVSTGVVIYIAATTFGLVELCKISPSLFHAIKYMGIGYLFFLSYKAFTTKTINLDGLDKVKVSKELYKTYVEGIFTTLVNPKELLFFCTFLPQFINEKSQTSIGLQLFYLGIWDVISGVIVGLGYALLVAKLRERFIQNTLVQNKLQFITGIIFGILAISLLWSV